MYSCFAYLPILILRPAGSFDRPAACTNSRMRHSLSWVVDDDDPKAMSLIQLNFKPKMDSQSGMKVGDLDLFTATIPLPNRDFSERRANLERTFPGIGFLREPWSLGLCSVGT